MKFQQDVVGFACTTQTWVAVVDELVSRAGTQSINDHIGGDRATITTTHTTNAGIEYTQDSTLHTPNSCTSETVDASVL